MKFDKDLHKNLWRKTSLMLSTTFVRQVGKMGNEPLCKAIKQFPSVLLPRSYAKEQQLHLCGNSFLWSCDSSYVCIEKPATLAAIIFSALTELYVYLYLFVAGRCQTQIRQGVAIDLLRGFCAIPLPRPQSVWVGTRLKRSAEWSS